MDFKVFLALAINGLAAAGAATGHSLSPEFQTKFVTDVTNVLSDLTIIMPIIVGWLHMLHVKKITNPSNQTSEKAS